MLLGVKLSYELVCPSVRSVGSVIVFLKGGKFHFHAPIAALVVDVEGLIVIFL